MDWLLIWYEVVLCGLLAAIHEPKQIKPVRYHRFNVWLSDLIAYTYPIDGYKDPVFDTRPSELDDATSNKARTGTRLVKVYR